VKEAHRVESEVHLGDLEVRPGEQEVLQDGHQDSASADDPQERRHRDAPPALPQEIRNARRCRGQKERRDGSAQKARMAHQAQQPGASAGQLRQEVVRVWQDEPVSVQQQGAEQEPRARKLAFDPVLPWQVRRAAQELRAARVARAQQPVARVPVPELVLQQAERPVEPEPLAELQEQLGEPQDERALQV
jgi:hypothetical protein